ncbi:unnamed protein product, partial [Nesidiocoris tenuis]
MRESSTRTDRSQSLFGVSDPTSRRHVTFMIRPVLDTPGPVTRVRILIEAAERQLSMLSAIITDTSYANWNSTSAMTCIRNLNPSLSSAGQALDSIGYRARLRIVRSNHKSDRTDLLGILRHHFYGQLQYLQLSPLLAQFRTVNILSHQTPLLTVTLIFSPANTNCFSLTSLIERWNNCNVMHRPSVTCGSSRSYVNAIVPLYRSINVITSTQQNTLQISVHLQYQIAASMPQLWNCSIARSQLVGALNWRFYLKSFLGSSYTPCRNRSSPRRIEPWAAYASDIYGPQLSTTAKFDCQLGRIRSKLWSSQGVHLYVTPLQPLQHQIPLTFRTCDETLILLRPSRFAT